MKRFFVIAVAAALAAFLSNNSWSYGSQGGGSGAAGGGGAAGSAGTTGAAGTAGTPGAAGASGTTGSPSGANATSGTIGATGTNTVGTGANANAAGIRATANGQLNSNFNGISPTPFFADPGVRSQLQLNNRQFNQLNAAYERAFQRYNRSLNSPAERRANLRAGTGNAGTPATPGAAPATASTGVANPRAATTTTGTAPGNTTANGTSGLTTRTTDGTSALTRRANPSTATAEQQRLARLQQLQNQFNTDFNPALDSAFTDPALRQRFNQLNMQFQGVGAFNDPLVQQQLNLTVQQRQQLAALNGEWRRTLMNLQRGTRSNLTQEQFNAMRLQFANRLNTVLTPAQLQLWTQLTGQPYDFPYTVYVPPTSTAPTNNVDAAAGSRAARTPQTPAVR